MSDESLGRRLASRRFIVTMLIVILSTVLRYNNLLGADNFETIIIWISGIYIVGKPVGDQLTVLLQAKT